MVHSFRGFSATCCGPPFQELLKIVAKGMGGMKRRAAKLGQISQKVADCGLDAQNPPDHALPLQWRRTDLQEPMAFEHRPHTIRCEEQASKRTQKPRVTPGAMRALLWWKERAGLLDPEELQKVVQLIDPSGRLSTEGQGCSRGACNCFRSWASCRRKPTTACLYNRPGACAAVTPSLRRLPSGALPPDPRRRFEQRRFGPCLVRRCQDRG